MGRYKETHSSEPATPFPAGRWFRNPLASQDSNIIIGYIKFDVKVFAEVSYP